MLMASRHLTVELARCTASGTKSAIVIAAGHEIDDHEAWLARLKELASESGVRIYGPSPEAAQGRAALATFNVEGIHPTDISTILDTVRVLPTALCWLA